MNVRKSCHDTLGCREGPFQGVEMIANDETLREDAGTKAIIELNFSQDLSSNCISGMRAQANL